MNCKYENKGGALEIRLRKLYSNDYKSISQNKSEYYSIIFFSPQCPICKSSVTEIKEIRNKFKQEKLLIAIVLPPKCLSDTLLLKQEFNETFDSISFYADENYLLVNSLKAKITPQAYLINSKGELLYNGMLTDYYKTISTHKEMISRHYLQDAITSDICGHKISPQETQAIGCLIE